jgi:hypothetical protein
MLPPCHPVWRPCHRHAAQGSHTPNTDGAIVRVHLGLLCKVGGTGFVLGASTYPGHVPALRLRRYCNRASLSLLVPRTFRHGMQCSSFSNRSESTTPAAGLGIQHQPQPLVLKPVHALNGVLNGVAWLHRAIPDGTGVFTPGARAQYWFPDPSPRGRPASWLAHPLDGTSLCPCAYPHVRCMPIRALPLSCTIAALAL